MIRSTLDTLVPSTPAMVACGTLRLAYSMMRFAPHAGTTSPSGGRYSEEAIRRSETPKNVF